MCRTTVLTPYSRRRATVAASGKVLMSAIRSSIESGLVLARPLTISGNPSVDHSV